MFLRGILLSAMMLSVSVQANEWRDPSKSEVRDMKGAADLSLKDAGSAKFQALRARAALDGKSIVICGLVNSKNSYGGYAGYEPFIFDSEDGGSFRTAADPSWKIVIEAVCLQ
jgi:hypothetical protein